MSHVIDRCRTPGFYPVVSHAGRSSTSTCSRSISREVNCLCNGKEKLAETVAIQTGFVPHCFTEAGMMADEQLKHLALIAHHCCRSFDLAFQCLVLLEERQVLETGSSQRYLGL
jgi:hypothetical protein